MSLKIEKKTTKKTVNQPSISVSKDKNDRPRIRYYSYHSGVPLEGERSSLFNDAQLDPLGAEKLFYLDTLLREVNFVIEFIEIVSEITTIVIDSHAVKIHLQPMSILVRNPLLESETFLPLREIKHIRCLKKERYTNLFEKQGDVWVRKA